MNILFNWDPSVANAPAQFKPDIEAAGAQLDSLLSQDNITLTVNVGFGEIGGVAMAEHGDGGEGGPIGGQHMAYAPVIQEMQAHTTDPANLTQLATLPADAPPGLDEIYVANSQLKLWGLMDPNSTEPDGQVGFASNLPYMTVDNRGIAGEYDLQGMAFHELTHALLDRTYGGLVQLADYTSPGVFASVNGQGYFSLDGGATNLGTFSATDTTDWQPVHAIDALNGDPFNLATMPGIAETNITPQDLALISWLGFKDAAPATPAPPTPTPPPTPPTPTPPPPATPTPPPAAANFQVLDQTTGQTTVQPGTPYTGPTTGIANEFIDITPHNLLIAGLTPNTFIHSGDGNDGINVSASGGNNTIDGEGGSNFLVGGNGNDTFYVNDLYATVPSWTTLLGFHAGDAATVWGVTPVDFQLSWVDGGGAPGYPGLTLYATSANKPEIALTVAGATLAGLHSGAISAQFGSVNNIPYLEITGLR